MTGRLGVSRMMLSPLGPVVKVTVIYNVLLCTTLGFRVVMALLAAALCIFMRRV